jgi:hypothetical protein
MLVAERFKANDAASEDNLFQWHEIAPLIQPNSSPEDVGIMSKFAGFQFW